MVLQKYSAISNQKLRVVSILIGVICSLTAMAQDGHMEIWGTYSTRRYLPKDRFKVRSDYGARTAFSTIPYTTFLYRPRAIFSIGNDLELNAAVDFRYTNYQNTSNILELRSWEGAQLNWPQVGRFMFDHFYRFEQRFFIIQGGSNDKVSLRSRYRLRMRMPINKPAITERTYYTDLQIEAYVPHDTNINELFANTVRLGVVVGYNHNIKWRYVLQLYLDRGRNEIDDNVTNDRAIVSFVVRNTF